MNNNNTSNIQEPKICCQCMTFYANPKFGDFCSKCFKDKNPIESGNQGGVKNEVVGKQNEIDSKKINKIGSEENSKEKEDKKILTRPVQVKSVF